MGLLVLVSALLMGCLASAQDPAISILRPGVFSVSAPELASSLQELLTTTETTTAPCPESSTTPMHVSHAGDKVLEVSAAVEFVELPDVCVLPAVFSLAGHIATSGASTYARGFLADLFVLAENLPSYRKQDDVHSIVLPAPEIAVGGILIKQALDNMLALADPVVCGFPLSGPLCLTVTPIADCHDSPVHENGTYYFSDTLGPADCVFIPAPRELLFPGDVTWRIENIDYVYRYPESSPVFAYRVDREAHPAAAFYLNLEDGVVYQRPVCFNRTYGPNPCPNMEYGSINIFTSSLINATFHAPPQCCREPDALLNVTGLTKSRGAYRQDIDGYTSISVIDDAGYPWSSWQSPRRIGMLYYRLPLAITNRRPDFVSHHFGPFLPIGVTDRYFTPEGLRDRDNWDTANFIAGIVPQVFSLPHTMEFTIKAPPNDSNAYLLFRSGRIQMVGATTLYIKDSILYMAVVVFEDGVLTAPTETFEIGRVPSHWTKLIVHSTLSPYEKTRKYITSQAHVYPDRKANITITIGDSTTSTVFRGHKDTIRLEMATIGTSYTPRLWFEGLTGGLAMQDLLATLKPFPISCYDFVTGARLYFHNE